MTHNTTLKSWKAHRTQMKTAWNFCKKSVMKMSAKIDNEMCYRYHNQTVSGWKTNYCPNKPSIFYDEYRILINSGASV